MLADITRLLIGQCQQSSDTAEHSNIAFLLSDLWIYAAAIFCVFYNPLYTFANSDNQTGVKCHKTRHFISVCTVCLDKINLPIYYLEIINCDSSIYLIFNHDIIVSNFMGNFFGTKSVD